jgi:hypothetical protein
MRVQLWFRLDSDVATERVSIKVLISDAMRVRLMDFEQDLIKGPMRASKRSYDILMRNSQRV